MTARRVGLCQAFAQAVARSVAGGVCAVLLLSGCSLGAQDMPSPLTSPTQGASAPGSATSGSDVTMWVTVFLVRGNRLVKVRRQTAVSSGFGPVVSALLKPLTVDDSGHGLRTALPVATSRLKVRVSKKVATVWLPAGFDHLAVADQILAIGQIVFTLTAHSDVTAVGFTNGSRSINVPDDHGRLVAGPVTRGDYAAIAPKV